MAYRGCALVGWAGTAAFLLISIQAMPAFGHGGGLDSYGCHHNRKAGGYHCHRGPMAGQSFSSKQEMLAKRGKADSPSAPKRRTEGN